MSNHKGHFTTGSIDKYLVSLTLPALITILVSMSFITADTYFLSRLGKAPLTAISFIFPVVSAFQMVGLGLGIAASSVLSRLIGAGKTKEVSIHIITLVLIGLLLAAISIPLLDLCLDFIFRSMGASELIMPYIRQFMHTWLIGVPLILTSYIGNNILRVHGKAKLSAHMQIGSSLVNVLLSPLFIFVFHWGMAGSALAGVIARLLMIGVMYHNIFDHYVPNIQQTLQVAVRKFWPHAKALCAIAIPAIMTNVIGPLSSLWMVHLLAKAGGGNIVAGFGIASRIEMLAVIPLYALSASIGPIIGQNMGAKLYERSYRTLKRSYQASILWGFAVAIVMLTAGPLLASVFTQDGNIIQAAHLYLSILPWSYASWGIIMMTNASFNSMGKPIISTLITTLRLVVLFIPLSYFLSIKHHYFGVFLAFAISNIIASACAAYTAIKQWRELNEHSSHMPTAAVASTGN
jgi:putative MATE family efflux protein